MPLNRLLAEAIAAAEPTEAGALLLSGAVASAAAAIDARAAGLTASKEHRADRAESKARWTARGQNLLAEQSAEQSKAIGFLLKGSSKVSLADLAARHTEVGAQVAIVTKVAAAIDKQIVDADRKIRAAELALLISQREWCHAEGIRVGHELHRKMIPLLTAEPNTVLDFSDSALAQYALKLSDLDARISTMNQRNLETL